MNEARRLIAAVATGALAILLAGCGASTDLVKPCCYDGEVALTHLADTRLTLESGGSVPFGEVFSSFDAGPSPLGRSFPFEKADMGLVTFASLRDVLPRYDANTDRILQEPELTALYVQEAARGLGYPVVGIEPSGGSGAIATSRADVSALVIFVERHLHEMAQPQRKIFRDLYWLGLEVRTLPHFLDDELDGLPIYPSGAPRRHDPRTGSRRTFVVQRRTRGSSKFRSQCLASAASTSLPSSLRPTARPRSRQSAPTPPPRAGGGSPGHRPQDEARGGRQDECA